MKHTRKDRNGKLVNEQAFIRYWQTAENVSAVANTFNISYTVATRWAYEYRKEGVNLKFMRWAGDTRWSNYGAKGGQPSHKLNRVRRARKTK